MTGGLAVRKATSGGLAPWQVELCRRVLNDLSEDHSVERIAALCGLSRSHFEKAFKTSLGAPPHRWLVRQRVQRAAEMLEQTHERIGLIALNCGFADQSHLTRVFRMMVGLSPAAWRRQRKAGVVAPLEH
jgi:AraC family transcriptional regulator